MSASPFIIPVFIPQAGCRQQCVFCNQETITGVQTPKEWELARQQAQATVTEYLGFKPVCGRKRELALFGGNFFGLPLDQIEWYLQFVQDLCAAGHIDALRFSTRPDTITRQTLSLLSEIPVAVVELGVQSMYDEVLLQARRGHTVEAVEQAVTLLNEFGLPVGLQIMPGLPGDTPELAFATGLKVAQLKPLCVRIYPTLVLKASPLAKLYHAGFYQPWSLEQAVTTTAKLYRLFRQNDITVIRMGLQAADNLQPGETIVAGPYHPAFGHLVVSHLFWLVLERVLPLIKSDSIEVKVHPSQISHLRGINNDNVQKLRQVWPNKSFCFIAMTGLAKTQIEINQQIFDIIH